jgi:DNA-directed RNA polymerase II subunit RPB2
MEQVLRSYFSKYGFCRHQVEGYDSFIHTILPEILHENTTVVLASPCGLYEHRVNLVRMHARSPTHRESDGSVFCTTPSEARTRKLTYSIEITCQLLHTETHYCEVMEYSSHDLSKLNYVAVRCSTDEERCELGIEEGVVAFTKSSGGGIREVLSLHQDVGQDRLKVHEVQHGHNSSFMIPCMVKSGLCTLTKKGFDKNECHKDSGGYFIINGHEKTLLAQQKLRTNVIFVFKSVKYGAMAEIRSCHRKKWRSTSTLRMFQKKGHIYTHVPFVMKGSSALDIPLETLLHALEPDDESGALLWIQTNSSNGCAPVTTEVLPHLGLDDSAVTVLKKKIFLQKMCKRLLSGALDDRDNQSNRRVDGSGPSIGILFRQIFRATMKHITLGMRRLVESKNKNINFSSILNFGKLTSAIRYHFATGNWSLNKGKNMGVVQLLTNMTAWSKRSHLNRVNVPINRDGKMTKPRLLDSSTFGILCPSESPEGASCGLMNNKALLCHVGLGISAVVRKDIISLLFLRVDALEAVTETTLATASGFVLLCGDIVAVLRVDEIEIETAAETMRRMKRAGSLPFDTGIVVADGDIHVMLQPGRCSRPLLFKEGLGNLDLDWDDMVYTGRIEYLDKVEEAFLDLPNNGDYSEVVEYAFMSEITASIPFSNHNQAPRNMYSASMQKQAIGWPSTAFRNLYDTHFVLHTPQRPLVQTEFDRISNSVPNTISCVVAIATMGGFNQEDSIIVSRASIERGLGDVTFSTTKSSVLNRNGRGDRETFSKPPPNARGQLLRTDYSCIINDDDTPAVGTMIHDNSCVIAKTASGVDCVPTCRSTVYNGPPARVDDVLRSVDLRGNAMRTVRLNRAVSLEVGDKMASRHGQKGTIGCIYNQEDMPYCPRTGMPVDILLNPHCIPSRMTIGQIIEMVVGKATCFGTRFDATPFRFEPKHLRQVGEILKENGYSPQGKQTLCSGITGEPLQCQVFVGVCAYQRLRHIASMKIHSRSTGPVSILTRQPLEGRSRGGGLRFGEMERDTLLSHGASNVMLDRLLYCSDPHRVEICLSCGLLVDTQKFCRFCEKKETSEVTMPYSFLLLRTELQAMGISTRIHLRPKKIPKGTTLP